MAETESQRYEKLGRSVIEGLAKLKGIDKSVVKWNAHPKSKTKWRTGKAFTHQIDVLWDFELENKPHRVAFECKNWNYPVDFSNLMRFVGVLGDLEEEAKGVVVTRAGYDISVEEYARVRGIGLLILDEVGTADFISGVVPEIIVSVTKKNFGINWKSIEYDPKSAEKAFDAMLIAKQKNAEIFDEKGCQIGTLESFLKFQLSWAEENDGLVDGGPVTTTTNQSKPLFFHGPGGERIRIKSVFSEIVELIKNLGTKRTTVDKLLQFIVEDEMYVVDSDGEVHKSSFEKEYQFDVGEKDQPMQLNWGIQIPLEMIKRPPRPDKNAEKKKQTAAKPAKAEKPSK